MADDVLALEPVPADARIRYGDDPSQFADLYRPAGDDPAPVAVLIHGGYWRAAYGLEHMSHLAEALRARGVATWSLEYRRLGGRPDAVPDRLALASPFELLPLGRPQILIHGQLDQIVPIELSRRYAARAAALGDPAELVELPGTGHFELIDPRRPQGMEVVARALRLLERGR